MSRLRDEIDFEIPDKDFIASNDGAAYAKLLLLGEPQIEDIIDYTEDYWPDAPDEKDFERLAIPGYTIARGGGTGNKGGHKSRKGGKSLTEKKYRQENVVEPRLPTDCRFLVNSLTYGEKDFYHRRPGVAKEVLESHVKALNEAIAAGQEPDAIEEIRSKDKTEYLVIYLSELDIKVLKTYRGTAKRALVAYARSKSSRIDEIDRTHKERRVKSAS